MKTPQFRYDVAFSFLAQDEDLAIKINDLLQDRLETFIYSRKQEELAGTDGEMTFNRVFGSEARIIFVLYRKGWGETPWTRIEETAIRNRGFEEGYDFVILAPLEKPPTTPKWLPKNRIWVGLDRWGVEGAASIIEARVQEAGGIPREESIEDRTARLSRAIVAERKKQDFLDSEDGVRAANEEVKALFSALARVVTNLTGTEEAIDVRVDAKKNKCTVYADGFTLFLHWSLTFGSTLQSSAFYVRLWKGFVGISGGDFFIRSKPTMLKELEVSFDLTSAGRPAWKEAHGEKRLFTTDELGKTAMTMLLSKVQETQLKKS